MSGILKTYFSGRKIKSLNNSACKFLKSYNDNQRLFNCGLLISENNILKINIKFPNSSIKTNTNYTSDYNIDETNPNIYTFNKKYFYPKKTDDSFYGEFLSNNLRKKQNKKRINPIYYNIFHNLSINKNESKLNQKYNKMAITSFPLFNKKKISNKVTISEHKIYRKIKKDLKKNILTNNDSKEKSGNKVEKIVNSLITLKKEKEKKLHHVNSSENLLLKKNKYENFPKEKTISPFAYIDYNLRNSPGDKKLFKSFNKQLKSLNNKPEYRDRILNQVDTNNRNRLKIEGLRNEVNNKIYIDLKKKEMTELFLDKKKDNKNMLHFNLFDYYNNIHNLKANKRIKFNKNYEKIKKLFKDNKRIITFDKKLDNFEISTLKAIKHLDSLSFSNRKMMKNILNIYSTYEMNNK